MVSKLRSTCKSQLKFRAKLEWSLINCKKSHKSHMMKKERRKESKGNFRELERAVKQKQFARVQPRQISKQLAILMLLLSIVDLQMDSIDCEPTIEVTRFQVPARALVGKTNRLICQYQLKGLSLHAMKLFKDNNEFYRYLPPNRQLDRHETKLVFEVGGVLVDERRSNGTHVLIGPLTKQSSGLYKCQVSIEDTFKSVSAERQMEVVTPAESQQTMNGKKQLASSSITPANNAFQHQSPSIPPSSFFKQEPSSKHQSRPILNSNANHHLPSGLAAATTNSAGAKNSPWLQMATTILVSSLICASIII